MLLLDWYVMRLGFVILHQYCVILHWLPIRARINLKVLLLTFKALHGLVPQYLQSLISVKTSCHNLRGSNTLLLAMPSVKSQATLGDRAFAIFAQSHV